MSQRVSIRQIALLVFQIIIFAGYAYLRLDNAAAVHEPREFGDTGEYFRIASLPVFSREFWTESKPPVTSLFWKLAGSDSNHIFTLQLYFSILCWGIFAFTAAQVVKSYWVKPLIFAMALTFTLSRDIIMWDPFLGSESIALSFTALFLACAMWLLSEWKTFKAILLIAAALLMAFTRDTSAYLLLMVAVILLPLFWSTRHRWGVTGISISFVLIYLVSSALANAGLRPDRALLMITSLRIYPSETYTGYFKAHGMPVDDKLVTMSRNPQPGQKFVVYGALESDPAQAAYRQWLSVRGRAEYFKFLWFFKADALQSVFLQTPQESFYPDVLYYTATGYRPILSNQHLSEVIYPTSFGLVFFFAASLLAAFLACYAYGQKKTIWLVPLLMILLVYPQAVLVWAGDANDIARHSIVHNVLLRLGVWILVFFVLDHVIGWMQARFSNSKAS